MTIEARYGVPTVAMHTDKFDKVVRSVAEVNGMPDLAQVFVPQPIMGRSAAQLRAYVDGKDPISGRPVMQEVIEGLTHPRAREAGAEYDRSTPRLVEADTEEDLKALFLERNWTDNLPIVLPTEERVAAMLAGTRRQAHEVVGRMRSTHFREYWEYTVEKVAVNAVMAGARAEYFPVILALAATGGTTRGSSSSAVACMAVVNGPIRREIGMNAGTGAMGPYSHANATIGRAYGLLSQNGQGGSVPGLSYMGNQGNNYAYNSLTFAENEERSPWGRSTSSTASSPTRARSASSPASAPRPSRWDYASATGVSTSATCCAASTRMARPRCCSTPSPPDNSSTAAASPRKTR